VNVAEVVARFKGVRFNAPRDAAFFICPVCTKRAFAATTNGRVVLTCPGGCSDNQMLAASAPQSPPTNRASPTSQSLSNGSGGHVSAPSLRTSEDDVVRAWQRRMGTLARNVLQQDPEFNKPHLTAELALEPLLETFGPIIQRSGLPDWQPPADLTPIEATELIEGAARTELSLFYADRARDLTNNGGAGAVALRALDAETFFRETEHLENIRWRWDRIAPSCGLIGIFGDPEAGKSTFSRTLALALASGADCLGRSCLASRVLYLDLAGETVSHRRAFKKLGWTGAEMKLLSTSEYLAGDPRALQVMADLFTGERIEVVFVDMMADLLNFKDLNDYANAKETMSKLRRLAVATNTLVIVLHHTPKALPPDADVLKAGLGSQAIVGSFDLRIAIRRRAKGLATISMSKGKLGGESLEGEWVIGCDLNTEKIELRNNWSEAQKDFYGEKIFDLLAQDIGTRMGATAVAEALNIEPSHIRGALSKLVRDSKIEREGKGKRGDGFRYWVTDAQQAIYGKPQT
jgi:hypothetical protein